MRIPKEKTIRGKFIGYAYKAGFTVVKQGNLYSLFDIRGNYYTHRNITLDNLVRVVSDELYAKEYRKNESPV